mgnify:CR=1 FL=1
MLIAWGYWNTVYSAHLVCNMQYAILARLRYAHRGTCDIVHGFEQPMFVVWSLDMIRYVLKHLQIKILTPQRCVTSTVHTKHWLTAIPLKSIAWWIGTIFSVSPSWNTFKLGYLCDAKLCN